MPNIPSLPLYYSKSLALIYRACPAILRCAIAALAASCQTTLKNVTIARLHQ